MVFSKAFSATLAMYMVGFVVKKGERGHFFLFGSSDIFMRERVGRSLSVP